MNAVHRPGERPWGDFTAPLIVAGNCRVLLNGVPPLVDCRVLSEENFQFAVSAVNDALNLAREERAAYAALCRAQGCACWRLIDTSAQEGPGPRGDGIRLTRMADGSVLFDKPVDVHDPRCPVALAEAIESRGNPAGEPERAAMEAHQ